VWIGPQDHKIVGTYLAELRQERRVTQVELARRLDKPQSFVSSYERGQRRVDFLEFTHIVLALGYDPCAVGSALLEKVVPHVQALPDGLQPI
jgi:transcriptional regulator with XRE-family HTH domain